MPRGPFRSDGAHRTQAGESASYRLLVGRQAILIAPGETLLGRGEDCGIVVSHSTVSRHHARVAFEAGSLSIEDLGSANGTYVNKARAFGRIPLKRGDWIALGSFEIEVLQQIVVDADDEDADRPTPISGMGVLGQPALSRSSPESLAAETDRSQRAPTEEDFESAGRLADRMFAAGRAQAAEQILAEPIVRILEAARAANPPTTAMVDALGLYALRLANATGQGRWVDAAIEIHWLAVRPLRVETLRQLASLRSRLRIGDDALIARYYETVRSRVGSMTAEERILVSLLGELVLGLESGR